MTRFHTGKYSLPKTLNQHFSHPQHTGPNRTERRAAEKAANREPPKPQRYVDPSAALNVLSKTRARNSTEPLSRSQLTALALGCSAALQSLMQGKGSWYDCYTLSVAANLSLLLCERGIAGDEQEKVQEAQEVIFTIERRCKAAHRFTLFGQEIKVLQDMLARYDAQLAHPECTEAVMTAAGDVIEQRLRKGNVLGVAP